MEKFTNFIINKRYFILGIFLVLAVICAGLSNKVVINYDIAEYLPDNSETRIGMDIMEEDFQPLKSSSFNFMIRGLADNQKEKIKERLENFENVESVDYEATEEYNKEDYTLYTVNIDAEEDSEIADNVFNEITGAFEEYEIATSGAIAERNTPVLATWIVVLAVGCALIILIIMSGSYVEPFLFLFTILIGILLNKGTNIILDSVSNITESITAILQLALSMDYSIMLMSRYNQEKEKVADKVVAMKNALYHAFKSISSSSITTIVGLIALVFMSFTIGRDLGFVLAKGVLFSLISIFFVLPTLILIFDKWIVKTQKKNPNINLSVLGKFEFTIRPISIIAFIAVFVFSFLAKGNLGILYTNSEDNEVAKVFEENNQMAIIYKNEDEEKIAGLLQNFENENKVEQTLGYGNTIHQKLTYQQLAEKLDDLGADVEIEDYLFKILYYNYYNQSEDNKMTFEEFIHFIQTQVYNNTKISNELDEESRKNIDRLAQFTTETSMNQLRNPSEIAEVLEIDKKDVEEVLIYYNSKNNNLKLTVAEFINFMNKDVLTNPEYAGKITKENQNQLNTLLKFTNSTKNDTKMSSQEMANLFGMDANVMNSLYQYYISLNEVTTRMTIAEFSNFVLNEVLNDPQYASHFDEATVSSIRILQNFSKLDRITRQMNSAELASVFSVDEAMVKQLLLLKYSTMDTGNTLSIAEFVKNVEVLKNNTNYLDGVDLSSLEKIAMLAENQNNINTTKMNKAGLASIFNQVRHGFVENIYELLGLSEDTMMTPQEFIHLVLKTLENANPNSEDSSAFVLDDATLNQLKLLKTMIDDSVSNNPARYTATEMAKLLGLNQMQTCQLYALIAFSQNQTANWTTSPQEFVNIILTNRENPTIASSVPESTMAQLNLLNQIMTSALQNSNYNFQELASFIGIDETKVKSIYTLYQVKHTTLQLTPIEFVNFVLAHRSDSALSRKFDT